MASAPSLDGYDVVTPVLSKAIPVSLSLSPTSELSSQADLMNEKHAEDARSTDDETPKSMGVAEDASKVSTRAGEGTATKTEPIKTIEINGTQYVETSEGVHEWHTITVNGITYVEENARKVQKSAYSVLQKVEYADSQDVSQEEICHANNSQFRGQPIKVYVGTGSQSYAVHPSILTKSDIGSMPLDEAEDGSCAINLANEDPIQFERLLRYLYRGTWVPECTANCGHCYEHSVQAQGCTRWTNKDFMRLYTLACKYSVYGLQALIAPRLNLREDILNFCEAFRYAYENCPGNTCIRELFRRCLLTVFENNALKTSWGDPWDEPLGNNSLAIQLADLASCGGDFAVDLVQTFASAKENAIRATVDDSQPGGHKDWANNDVEKSDAWEYPPGAESDISTGCWGETVQMANDSSPTFTREEVKKIQGRLCELEEMVFNDSSTSVIQADVKTIQGRLHGLEDMVSNLQLSFATKSAQTQQAAFPNSPLRDVQPCIPQGWGPTVSLQQPSRFKPGFGRGFETLYQPTHYTNNSVKQGW